MMKAYINKFIIICLSLAMIGMSLYIPSISVRADEKDEAVEDDTTDETRQISEMKVVHISSVIDLVALCNNCIDETWSLDKYVMLDNDISLSGIEFEGIPSFSGVFDGCGHSITDMTIDGDRSYSGLFCYVGRSGLILALNVKGNIEASITRYATGGIAGENNGVIKNCCFNGNVSGGDFVGGIAGINDMSGQIFDTVSEGNVSGRHCTGGIAGRNDGSIRGCENRSHVNTEYKENPLQLTDLDSKLSVGNVDALLNGEEIADSSVIWDIYNIGGIAGRSSGVIGDCVNNGNVGYEHVGYNIGGIAGIHSGYIYGCTNNAYVCGKKDVGGIVGQAEPYVRLEVNLETFLAIQESIESLHGQINKTLNDVGNTSQVLANRLTVMQQYTTSAMGDMAYLASDTVDYANSASNAVNQTYSRIDMLVDDTDKTNREFRAWITDTPGANNNWAVDSVQRYNSYIHNMSVSDRQYMGTFDENYDAHMDSLNGNVQGLMNNYGVLINEVNGQTQQVVNDMRSISSQIEKIVSLCEDAVTEASERTISDMYRDDSVLVADDCKESTIDGCINMGQVFGDTDCAGIVGIATLEADLYMDDAIQVIEESRKVLVGQYIACCVIRNCDNRADIRSEYNYIGGICGRQTTGVIKNCSSFGDVESASGQYAGGITGASDSDIMLSTSKGRLTGSEYVGGIAGDGNNIANCLSMVTIDGATDWYGAVAGHINDESVLEGNCFISDNLSGVNRISYKDKAENISFYNAINNEALNIPDDFGVMRITFLVEDGDELTEVGKAEVGYDSNVTSDRYPAVDAPAGYYVQWEQDALYKVREDIKLKAHYVQYLSTIADVNVMENGQSRILVDGRFRTSDELGVMTQEIVHYDTDEEYILSRFVLTIPDDGRDLHTVRFYIDPEITSPETTVVPYFLGNGTWAEAPNVRVMGNYLLFDVPGTNPSIKVVWNQYKQFYIKHTILPLVLIGVAVLVVIVLMIIMLVHRKSIAKNRKMVVRAVKKKIKNAGTDDLFYHAKEDEHGEESEGIEWQEIAKEWGIDPGKMEIAELKADNSDLDKISAQLDKLGADDAVAGKAYLVSEEMFLNIVDHAHADYVKYFCAKKGNDIIIAFWDNGSGFDPTKDHKEEVNDTLVVDVELGIKLIKSITTQWIYTRHSRENCNFMRVTS